MKAYCEITSKCNLKCKFCYYNTNYIIRESSKEPSWKEIKHNIDFCGFMGCDSISFTGGEPFCRKEILFPCIDYACNLGMKVYVPTNGKDLSFLTNEEWTIINRVHCITVSLNIDSKLENVDIYLSNLKEYFTMLRKIYRGRIRVNYTFTKENYIYIRDIDSILTEIDVDMNLQPVVVNQSAKKMFLNYALCTLNNDEKIQLSDTIMKWAENTHEEYNYDYAKKMVKLIDNIVDIPESFKCYAGEKSLFITVDSDVCPCFYCRNEKKGNVINDDWHEIKTNLNQFARIEKKCNYLQCIVMLSSVQ